MEPEEPTSQPDGAPGPALGPLELVLALGPAVLGAVVGSGGLESQSLDQGRAALIGSLVGLAVGVVLVIAVAALRRRQ